MIISDTSCMIEVFTIALLTAEFGQSWDYENRTTAQLCSYGLIKVAWHGTSR